ncbi:hypothetical protein [Pelosinus sp. UFO1]|uniref:hypothetical protein n=1 Tax=Pelosinus sp. UFO1 TaxID=484770 RepID=UPI0004D161D3|nr:hypothetical protein [Pelosinus sp. UFO1]AIF50822.1 hypothetical protein UFO1_1267 [Pelosinus sp. UFO1]
MMKKRQEIVRDIGEDLVNIDMNDVFDQLDKYHMDSPSMEATNQLIQSIKPVFIQERARINQGQRFRDVIVNTRQDNGIPVILQLIVSQMTLMSRGFVTLTITFFIVSLLLASIFERNLPRVLVIASPLLGLLTLFYEYRAQIYKVEEMEATCRYSPVQVATARMLIVLSYNVMLCTAATVIIQSSYNVVIWNLMLNWLSPLLLMLGVALFTSLKLGITSGCTMAGALWICQVTLIDGDSFLHLLLPNLTSVVINLISMLLGIGLLIFSLRIWKPEERLV